MIKGKIHSLESFGTVDGPGIRFVVFMQGCPLRCLYCHNPDTWNPKGKVKYQMTPGELLTEVLRYKSFIARGGVTVTGGEPLLQPEFLKEFFRLCQEQGLHTALDTSGFVCTSKAWEVLDYADLVLLDIKTLNPDLHPLLAGVKPVSYTHLFSPFFSGKVCILLIVGVTLSIRKVTFSNPLPVVANHNVESFTSQIEWI